MSFEHEIARLSVSLPDGESRVVSLADTENRLGRGSDADIRIDDPSVSRHHALIREEGKRRYVIADLGSSNGTFVNGERIQLPSPLYNGDRLRIGAAELQFVAPLAIREDAVAESLQDTLGLTETLDRGGPEARPSLVAASAPMLEALELAQRASESPIPVTIQGETGTGKELLARAIHADGPRQARPFLAINCASLPENLLESELFGHRKGAFTGAHQDRKGLLEAADGGTIFLDEIGEMSLGVQPKLLRFLQEGEIQPIGANEPHTVDVRVLAATHRDLEMEVREERFREDLFFRLTPITIVLPPLRERRDDIPLLAERLLRRACARHGVAAPVSLSTEASEALLAYDWPGNVRELENELLRAVAISGGDSVLPVSAFSARVQAGSSLEADVDSASPATDNSKGVEVGEESPDLRDALSRFERQHIEQVLAQHDDNVSATARALGVSRGALHKKLKEYGLR